MRIVRTWFKAWWEKWLWKWCKTTCILMHAKDVSRANKSCHHSRWKGVSDERGYPLHKRLGTYAFDIWRAHENHVCRKCKVFSHVMLHTSPWGVLDKSWAKGRPPSDTQDVWHRWWEGRIDPLVDEGHEHWECLPSTLVFITWRQCK